MDEQKQAAQNILNESRLFDDAVKKGLNKQDAEKFWRYVSRAQAINPTIAVDRDNPVQALNAVKTGMRRITQYGVPPEERVGEQIVSEPITKPTEIPPIPPTPLARGGATSSASVASPTPRSSITTPSVGVPNITNIPGAGRVGKGILGRIGKTGVGKALASFGAKALAKLGLSSVAAAATGGLSYIAQALLELGGRALSWLKTKFKINSKKVAEYLGALTIGLGVIAPLSGAAAVGAVVAGAGALALGGTGAFSAGAGAIVGGILAIMAAVVSVVVAPIVISLIVIPLFLAVTIFIITSGGYIVPPGDNFVSSEGVGGGYPNCWPTRGRILQGPYCETGSYTHCPNLNAIDIGAPDGTKIYATHDGTVSLQSGGGYGNAIIIKSPIGFSTLYGHMLEIFVSNGQEVKAGNLIGLMNGDPSDPNHGVSDTPHLHYELRDAPYNIDQVVPGYTYHGQTTGCFANEAGGSDEPPTPGGSTPKPTPISTPKPTTTPLPGAKPASCSAAGGECSNDSNCVPESLPAGASGWDCPASAPKCCLKGLPAG